MAVSTREPLNMQPDGGKALVYTMRDLSQEPDRVMREIAEAGKPTFITRYGRFVAIITPLPWGRVESQMLAALAREIGEQDGGSTC